MEDGMFFNQSKYINEMLKKFGLEDSKPTKTLISTDMKLTKDDEAGFMDSFKYRGFRNGWMRYEDGGESLEKVVESGGGDGGLKGCLDPMKQNEKNFQTIFKNMESKIDEWEKSQNISSEQTNWTEPQPPPQAQTEQVYVVFTRSGKLDDSLKIQTLPPMIVKDKPINTSKGNYHMVKTKEYLFRGAWIDGWHFTLGDLYNWSIILHVVEYTCLVFRFAPYPS
nr:retrovirus-related Pol polyprotein from transposon TNT 1-94 [Tanacetum cinerariifolium]